MRPSSGTPRPAQVRAIGRAHTPGTFREHAPPTTAWLVLLVLGCSGGQVAPAGSSVVANRHEPGAIAREVATVAAATAQSAASSAAAPLPPVDGVVATTASPTDDRAATSEASAARAPAPLELTSIEAAVANLKGPGRGGDAATILATLGSAPGDRAILAGREVTEAVLVRRNLDRDPESEVVLRIDIDQGTADPDGLNAAGTTTDAYLVFADVTDGRLVPVGRTRRSFASCIVTGSMAMSFEPVHARDVDDVIIHLASAPNCNGHYTVAVSTLVFTVERGKLDQILEHMDLEIAERGTGNPIAQPDRIVFAGNPPKEARVVDANGRRKRIVGFDPDKFGYPQLQTSEDVADDL